MRRERRFVLLGTEDPPTVAAAPDGCAGVSMDLWTSGKVLPVGDGREYCWVSNCGDSDSYGGGWGECEKELNGRVIGTGGVRGDSRLFKESERFEDGTESGLGTVGNV